MILSDDRLINTDANTINRYIKSCKTLEQLEVCDNILWDFRNKYKNDPNFFECIVYDKSTYQSWFEALCIQYDEKLYQLNKGR